MISKLQPIIGRVPVGTHDKGDPSRQWYTTQAWRRLREYVFVRDNCRCAKCKEVITDKAKLVCHHKQPHQGQAALFWEIDNLITTCVYCYARTKIEA